MFIEQETAELLSEILGSVNDPPVPNKVSTDVQRSCPAPLTPLLGWVGVALRQPGSHVYHPTHARPKVLIAHLSRAH